MKRPQPSMSVLDKHGIINHALDPRIRGLGAVGVALVACCKQAVA